MPERILSNTCLAPLGSGSQRGLAPQTTFPRCKAWIFFAAARRLRTGDAVRVALPRCMAWILKEPGSSNRDEVDGLLGVTDDGWGHKRGTSSVSGSCALTTRANSAGQKARIEAELTVRSFPQPALKCKVPYSTSHWRCRHPDSKKPPNSCNGARMLQLWRQLHVCPDVPAAYSVLHASYA